MKIQRGFIGFAISVAAIVAAAQSQPKAAAMVNGETITEEQVTKAAAADLQKLDANRPQSADDYAREKLKIMHKALDGIVEDKLFAAEAAKQKISKEQYIHNEIESNVETPSDDEVAAFYEANKARIPLNREQALPQLRQYLIDQSRKQYHDPLVRRLRKEYGVKGYLDPIRTEVATAGYPSRGPAAAPVTIVEFSDFECPFCGGLFPTLKAVEKNYGDNIRIVYRQFPLTTIHPHAQKAAEASLCANEQQRFWEFHDSMFGNQQDLTIDALKRRAVELKLDTASFNACLDSGKQADAVRKDIEEGSRAGVTGTPAMFINGRMLSGNQPYADIREIIEDELQRSRARQ
jgi:protein-disulfide isomerase